MLFGKGLFKEKVSIKNTKSLILRYTAGYYAYAEVKYELELKDNTYIASYKMTGIPENEKLKKEVNEDTVIEIENILKKYEVSKWNGFNKRDNSVLDGNSFSFNYTNKDNQTISASGYMMYPKNYNNLKNDINDLYEKLFKEEIKNKMLH